MHTVVRRMMNVRAPEVATQIDEKGTPIPLALRVLCPVHAVEARVWVFVTPGNESPRLAECSLRPGEGGRPACEGQCVVVAGEEED